MKTAQEILNDAKAILAKRGWFQGGMLESTNEKGRCCVLHAVEEAAGMPGEYLVESSARPVDVAYTALVKVTGIKHGGLGAWNDDPTRKLEEVNAALDAAIKTL